MEAAAGRFPVTQVETIQAAQAGDTAACEAVACRYLAPLYGFARAEGWSHEDAEDEVNAFLSRFLEASRLGGWMEGRGPFRNFLLACFKNHLHDAHRHRRAERRGAGAHHTPVRWHTDSTGYAPVGGETPDQAFDRLWAAGVARRALQLLAAEQHGRHRVRYAELEPLLLGNDAAGPQSGEIRTALSRLRTRLRVVFRELITWPGATDEEVKAEMRYLQELLGRNGPAGEP